MRLGRSLLFITLCDSFAEAGEVRAITGRVMPLTASPGRNRGFPKHFLRKEDVAQLLLAVVQLLNLFLSGSSPSFTRGFPANLLKNKVWTLQIVLFGQALQQVQSWRQWAASRHEAHWGLSWTKQKRVTWACRSGWERWGLIPWLLSSSP